MKKDEIQIMAGYFWKEEIDDEDEFLSIHAVLDNASKWNEELSDVDETTDVCICFSVNEEVMLAFMPKDIFLFLEMMWVQKKTLLEGSIVIAVLLEACLVFYYNSKELEIISLERVETVKLNQITNSIISNNSTFYLCENIALADLLQELQKLGIQIGKSFTCPFDVWEDGLDAIISDVSHLFHFLINDTSDLGKNWKLPVNQEGQSESRILNKMNYFLSQQWKSGVEEIEANYNRGLQGR